MSKKKFHKLPRAKERGFQIGINKSKQKLQTIKAVTLIELLLVISVIGILGASGYSFGSNFLSRNNLKNKTNEIVSSLATAQINSISGKNDSQWGLYIGNGKIVMFEGTSYVEPGSIYDQEIGVPSSISITPTELVFDKLTGNPSATATIVVSNNLGETNTINVNEVGIVELN